MERLPKRNEVQAEHTWNLESIYSSLEQWEQDFERVAGLIPKLSEFQGKLGSSGQTLLAALKVRDEVYQALSKAAVFANMRRDEDTANSTHQALSDRVMSLYSRVGAAGSYITPEVLSIPTERLEALFREEQGLQVYRHELDDLLREKAHVRSPEVEALLAQASEVAAGPGRIFSVFANADLKFPKVTDEHGKEVELTEGRFPHFRESPDRGVRESAFRALFGTYNSFRNALAAMYGSSVKRDVFFSRSRNYPSARAMALSGSNIPESVYDNLVATVDRNLPSLHRYLQLRKRLLSLDELHMWDLYPPMVPDVNKKVPYEEAMETILQALQPLGKEYVATARAGLTTDRWVDRYENEGKRSGAYSSGTYATEPFILMNYNERLDSMFTLAHELGHSMHTHHTHSHQPFHYSGYTIFVAEVASTFNEALLTHHLLQSTSDKKLRMYLLNHHLEQFRATLFRQTMFAEFEQQAHQHAEKNQALTAEWLCSMYLDLNKKYYEAPGVVVDDEIAIEWGRIPHFYGAFYVYQYATGLSAAVSLSQQVLREGQPAVERYLNFLKKGSSDYSINILKDAGVDMSSPDPVQQALDVFAGLLDEMESLVG